MAKKPTFISYTNDTEVLVTTPALEKEMLKVWFAQGSGRITEEDACKEPLTDDEIYERREIFDECVEVSARVRIDQCIEL